MCVGNKMDLPCPTRDQDEKAAEAWCAAHGVGILFASACDGTGVAVAMARSPRSRWRTRSGGGPLA